MCEVHECKKFGLLFKLLREVYYMNICVILHFWANVGPGQDHSRLVKIPNRSQMADHRLISA